MFAAIVYAIRKQHAPVRDALRKLAESEGWTAITTTFLGGGVRGRSGERLTMMEYSAIGGRRGSGIVGTVAVKIVAAGPRLAISRRDADGDALTRPIVVTGPPLVDLPAINDLWVRCDDVAFARQLVYDSTIAAAIRSVFDAGVSEIAADGRVLTLQRPLRSPDLPLDPAKITGMLRATWRAAATIAAPFAPVVK